MNMDNMNMTIRTMKNVLGSVRHGPRNLRNICKNIGSTYHYTFYAVKYLSENNLLRREMVGRRYYIHITKEGADVFDKISYLYHDVKDVKDKSEFDKS